MNESQAIETEVVGQKPLFDYSALDQEMQITLRLRASEIKTLAKRVASDIVEIGGKLAEVKDTLGGNGRFNEWLSSELGWSERTAYNFIGVWQKFGAANFALENVATSALYLLAAPSTPPEVVQSAARIADEGKEVTRGVAKALIKEAKAKWKAVAPGFLEGGDAGEEDDPEAEGDEEEPGLDEGETTDAAEPTGAKKPTAKAPAAAPAQAKAGSSAKEVEAAWRKYGVSVTVQLLPAKFAERTAIVTVRAGDLEPLSKVKKESEVMFVGGVLEVIEQYKRDMPAMIGKAKTAAKTPAKPAAKPAAKQPPKAGAKQTTKGAKQKPAKAGK